MSVNDAPRPTHVEELFSPALWKRYARSGALVLITGVSLYLLLPSLLAVFGSWRSLGGLTWYWAALALACEAGSFVLLWELDRIALHVKSWFAVASSQLAGNAVGKIVPGGGATATAFSVALLRRTGVDAGDAAVALAASTSLQVGTALALPVLALPAIVGGAAIDRGLATSAYLGALVLAILAVASVIVFAFDEPLESTGRGLQWLLNRTIRRRRNLHGVPERLRAERDFVRATIGHRWKAAVLSAAGSTAFDFLALVCALRAVGAQPRPSLVIIAYAGAKLLVFVPFTPGGLGFVEAGLVGTLTLAGVSAQDALLATLTYRLVSYWIPIPAGGAAYIMYRRRYPDEPPRNAEFPHGVSTVSDSSSALEDESRSPTPTWRSQMETIAERVSHLAEADIKRVRWALGINGILSIALGVVILIWPGISLYALTIVFGAFTLATGVVGIGAAISGPMKEGRAWLVVSSLLNIGVGIVVLVWPSISALALLYVIGAYAIALGIITVGGAFWLPLTGGDAALMVLWGLLAIIFGVVMFAKPGDGALVLLALIAAFTLVRGVSELVVAIGGKRLMEHDLKRAVARRAEPQPTS